MNWRSLDLNLLVVLDAVAEERRATRAALDALRTALKGATKVEPASAERRFTAPSRSIAATGKQ